LDLVGPNSDVEVMDDPFADIESNVLDTDTDTDSPFAHVLDEFVVHPNKRKFEDEEQVLDLRFAAATVLLIKYLLLVTEPWVS